MQFIFVLRNVIISKQKYDVVKVRRSRVLHNRSLGVMSLLGLHYFCSWNNFSVSRVPMGLNKAFVCEHTKQGSYCSYNYIIITYELFRSLKFNIGFKWENCQVSKIKLPAFQFNFDVIGWASEASVMLISCYLGITNKILSVYVCVYSYCVAPVAAKCLDRC